MADQIGDLPEIARALFLTSYSLHEASMDLPKEAQ